MGSPLKGAVENGWFGDLSSVGQGLLRSTFVPNLKTDAKCGMCIRFHIFVVGENRDFKFGMKVDRSKP